MAIFTELNIDKVVMLARNYSIGDVVDFFPLQKGSANSNYLVQTSLGKFVFRVCNEKSAQSINRYTNVLVSLAETDFPANWIVRTKNGKRFSDYNAKRRCI